MYYSRQLFEFVKAVLFVIPVNIFEHLNEIAAILSTEVKELEVRISKETLKENTHSEKRFLLAKKTHQITMFTEGMLVLDNVLMGVINIEPKEILVEGLRKQLCQTVAKMLHDAFIFTAQVGTVKTNVDHSKQGAMG